MHLIQVCAHECTRARSRTIALCYSDSIDRSRKCTKTARAWYILIVFAREWYATVADGDHEARQEGGGWLSRERDTPRAGDSAFAGPRSPAPLAGGSTSDTGHAACTNFSGTWVNRRYPTPGRCRCQAYWGVLPNPLTPQRAAQCRVLHGVRVQSQCRALRHDKKSSSVQIPARAIPVCLVQQDSEN